jgi:hypothetical protein
MKTELLTLAEAIKTNRLPEFIKQAENRIAELGASHPDAKEVQKLIDTAARTPRPADET